MSTRISRFVFRGLGWAVGSRALASGTARSSGFGFVVGLFGSGVGLATVLVAQTAPGASTAGPDEEITRMERVLVTGSNIGTAEVAGEAGPLPLVSYDRAAIERTGYQTVAELLQKTTVSNAGAVPRSNNATGYTPAASSVSLHGLGPEATLVLINGHRVANYPIGDGGTVAFVDLQTIPLSAVERIEVLKDGASAIYGADAVAGVMNLTLRARAEGTTLSLHYGNTTEKDSGDFSAGLVWGQRGERLDLMVALNHSRRGAIFNRDRAYSATPPFLSTNSSPINIHLTAAAYAEATGLPPGSTPPGVPAGRAVFFATPGVTPGAPGGNTLPADGNRVEGGSNHGLTPASQYVYRTTATSRFNYNQFSGSFPESERTGLTLAGEFRPRGRAGPRIYFDAIAQRNYVVNELAPSATGFFTFPGNVELVIPARTPNPLPLPDGRVRAAPAGAYNPFNPFNQDLANGTRFRTVEFGNRIFRDTNDASLATLGYRTVRSADQWSADAGFRYSRIVNRTDNTLVSRSRFNRILNQADPIFNAASPEYIGSPHAYNPFGYYANPIPANQAAVEYATVRTKGRYDSSLANGFLTLACPEWRSLPAGPLGVAVGLDYRREEVSQSPDAFGLAGDILGSAAEVQANAAREVGAVFAEAQVPLVAPAQERRWTHDLKLFVAARLESFLTSHQSKVVPKVALRWQPAGETLTARASWGTGIRQPSIFELYNSNSAGLALVVDPRTSGREEVPAQIHSNPRLRPETTASASAGVVWTPAAAPLRGLTLAVDAWRVEREGTVTARLQNTVDRFFGAAPGGPQPGESVALAADGSMVHITSLYLNSGRTIADGMDFTGSWLWTTTQWGRLELHGAASRLRSMRIARLPGLPLVEMVNQDATDGLGDDGYLRWKARTGVTWSGGGLTVGATAILTDGFQDVDLSGANFQVDSTWTCDVQVRYETGRNRPRWARYLTVTAGASNVTDRRPPASYGGGASSTGYPGFLYSAEGRMVYLSVEKRL